MKIYFAGSIRGGREDKELYLEIIKYLQTFGEVLTEHIGDANLSSNGEASNTDEWIFNRDVNWLKEADLIVAEVTSPSLGVGYEIGLAESLNKRIICLYRTSPDKRLSAMIAGNKAIEVFEYSNLEEIKNKLRYYFSSNASKSEYSMSM